ncbi:hypothetical protein PL9631_240015 [Planktothrix paucivesiculata PCC 9631]|uniref:Uncharacterized protein n=1 Tax=Planktothrix paucivesiculata PCC 9631 TaxID=671071 RepID=A0A7Z9BKU3_9CYAN|nr:hypothetical protein PL9631_240015 [Planktothrix paucivesiculata PCC 9631]
MVGETNLPFALDNIATITRINDALVVEDAVGLASARDNIVTISRIDSTPEIGDANEITNIAFGMASDGVVTIICIDGAFVVDAVLSSASASASNFVITGKGIGDASIDDFRGSRWRNYVSPISEL